MVVALLQEKIKSSVVFVLSKAWCPFCRKVKQAMDKANIRYTAFEIEDEAREPLVDNVHDYKDAIKHLTGSTSVPKVWVGGKLVGGCDDTLDALSSGKLQQMYQQATSGCASGDSKMSQQELMIRTGASNNAVFLVSREWCPFCKAAKKALAAVNANVEVLELEDVNKQPLVPGDVEDWRAALKSVTGTTSVPKLFIGGDLLGGGDDTAAAHKDGSLASKIMAAGGLKAVNDEADAGNRAIRYFSNGTPVTKEEYAKKVSSM